LKRRLDESHIERTKIVEKLSINYAGFRGEQSIEYYLSLIDNKTNRILHDIRLQGINNCYFQIDYLIVSQKYCIIMEVKHIKGTLYFDRKFNQLLRIDDSSKETGFPDPILQVNRQKSQLQYFLRKHNLSNVPVIPLVIISYPSTIIKATTDHKDVSQVVKHSGVLPSKLESLERKYRRETLTKTEFNKLLRIIRKHSTVHLPNVLNTYNVSKSDILTGVYCPFCQKIPMKKIRSYWSCTKCNSVSKNAYLLSLIDFALLINPVITNKDCREFLHINSVATTSRLLQSLNVETKGTYKDRKYILEISKLKESIRNTDLEVYLSN